MNKNFADLIYKNLPVTEEIVDKEPSTGLLARRGEQTRPEEQAAKTARQRVAKYVSLIRQQRRELKDGN